MAYIINVYPEGNKCLSAAKTVYSTKKDDLRILRAPGHGQKNVRSSSSMYEV